MKTGVGFKQFLIRCRVTEAKRMLERTDWKIARIAYDAGFMELSTFNRDFRSITGVSPSAYRKLCT
jgi:two-component system, response regulator YesN